MYFVDRKKIEEILGYYDKLLAETAKGKGNTFADKLFLERTVHMAIEAIIDVGNMMIDGFIMRDPGSYEDIIDILTDEKVIPAAETDAYKEFIELRNMVVRDYLHIDHHKLEGILESNRDVLLGFSKHIRTYLTNELGVANAFSNE